MHAPRCRTAQRMRSSAHVGAGLLIFRHSPTRARALKQAHTNEFSLSAPRRLAASLLQPPFLEAQYKCAYRAHVQQPRNIETCSGAALLCGLLPEQAQSISPSQSQGFRAGMFSGSCTGQFESCTLAQFQVACP